MRFRTVFFWLVVISAVAILADRQNGGTNSREVVGALVALGWDAFSAVVLAFLDTAGKALGVGAS